MQEIQLKLLDDCVKKLNALGCKFCIITPGGASLGTLQIAIQEDKTRRYRLRWNGVQLEKEVEGMQTGDVRVVKERPEGSLEDLRSALMYRAEKFYGAKTCTAMVNHKTTSVEIMRIV